MSGISSPDSSTAMEARLLATLPAGKGNSRVTHEVTRSSLPRIPGQCEVTRAEGAGLRIPQCPPWLYPPSLCFLGQVYT